MEDKKFCYKYPHPSVTTDCVIFALTEAHLELLLVERGREPYKGRWALPGGFMEIGETAEACARRELEEETGLREEAVEQFHAFTAVDRDPRERVVSIAHYALVRKAAVRGGDDAARARWFPLGELPPLAFDHDLIIRCAQEALAGRIALRPMGLGLLDEPFTASDLCRFYQALGTSEEAALALSARLLQKGIAIPADDAPADGNKNKEERKYCFDRTKYAEADRTGFAPTLRNSI